MFAEFVAILREMFHEFQVVDVSPRRGVADRAKNFGVLIFKVVLSTLILSTPLNVSSSKKMMVPPPHPPTPPNKAGNLLLMTHGRQTNQW